MDSLSSKLYNKIFPFLIDNKFTLTYIVVLIIHLIMAVSFGIMKVPELTIFNAFSCLLYIFCIFLSSRGNDLIAYYFLSVEILSCAIISTVYAGWACGFSQLLIAFIPVAIYFVASSCSRSLDKIISVVNIFIQIIAYILLNYFMYGKEAVYELSLHQERILYVFTTICMCIAIVSCCAIYSAEVKQTQEFLISTNQALTLDAQVDPLTGLLNRRGFLPVLHKYVEERRIFSVAMCDIDNFKRVNDTYGHDAGDEILRQVTSIIKREANGYEVCRWGGEEIVIVFVNLGLDRASNEMEKIRKAIESHVTVFDDNEIKVTITIGVEQHRDEYKNPDDAITVADGRLYYGKHHGKNVVINCDMEESE